MKTTPREILHDIQAKRIELDKLVDKADKLGFYDVANDLSGSWISLDLAIARAANEVDLDGEVEG